MNQQNHSGKSPKPNNDRLLERIERLGKIGGLSGGGVCRLALTDKDRDGRDLVLRWMKDLGLSTSIDKIGNVIGIRPGLEDCAPVMMGSHIDSVATGGLYDGALGVLAGLEAIQTLNDTGITTRHPIAVGYFTNEEGARFPPDMMGSAVHQGSLSLEEALSTEDKEGISVGSELDRMGYSGDAPVNDLVPHSYLELHIEQGPVLEESGITIGAVTGVQGISWMEYLLNGTSNHAGTTPMRLRHDAGFVAAAVTVEARSIANEIGGHQVATVGVTELRPNLVNVISNHARITVDLRNTSEDKLSLAESRMIDFVVHTAANEGVKLEQQILARFTPVKFDDDIISLVESAARDFDLSCQRLPSGAGHDAQMFAPNCPTGMIFVPSQGGISHNVKEFTSPADIAAGMNVMMKVLTEISE